MPFSMANKLVIGITSRALFDLEEADSVFKNDGISAYRAYQQHRELLTLDPGTGFSLVANLLRMNALTNERLVEVVVISRNDADSGIRILNSIELTDLTSPGRPSPTANLLGPSCRRLPATSFYRPTKRTSRKPFVTIARRHLL